MLAPGCPGTSGRRGGKAERAEREPSAFRSVVRCGCIWYPASPISSKEAPNPVVKLDWASLSRRGCDTIRYRYARRKSSFFAFLARAP